MDEIKGIARVKFHPGKVEGRENLPKGGPKLFTPWMTMEPKSLAEAE